VDKVKALANTKGLYDTAPFDRLPLFQRFREYLTDDLVKSKKNTDMIVSKAKIIMWFVNGNAEKVERQDMALVKCSNWTLPFVSSQFFNQFMKVNVDCRYIRIVLLAKFNVSRCLLKLPMAASAVRIYPWLMPFSAQRYAFTMPRDLPWLRTYGRQSLTLPSQSGTRTGIFE
jgi:hypothetical protein